jgi:hypothetical protein
LLGVGLRGEGGRAFWEMIVVLAAVGSGVGLAGRRDLRAVGAAVPAGSCELVSAPYGASSRGGGSPATGLGGEFRCHWR